MSYVMIIEENADHEDKVLWIKHARCPREKRSREL